MQKFIFGCLFSMLFQSLYAQSLTSFSDITQHLTNGNEINLLVDLNHCEVNDPNDIKITIAKWFVTPQNVIYTDELLSIDGSKYAHGRPPLPASGLLQRGSIIIDAKGNAHIVLSFFEMETNKKFMQDVKVECPLNSGLMVFTRAS